MGFVWKHISYQGSFLMAVTHCWLATRPENLVVNYKFQWPGNNFLCFAVTSIVIQKINRGISFFKDHGNVAKIISSIASTQYKQTSELPSRYTYISNPVWIESSVWSYCICHSVMHRKMQNKMKMIYFRSVQKKRGTQGYPVHMFLWSKDVNTVIG